MIYINADEETENITEDQIIDEIEEVERTLIEENERKLSVFSIQAPPAVTPLPLMPGIIAPDPILAQPNVHEIFPGVESPKKSRKICCNCCPRRSFRTKPLAFEEVDDEIGASLFRQVLAASIGCANGILVGLSIGYTSVGLDSFVQERANGNAPFFMSKAEVGIFGSVINLGSMVGAIFSGWIGQRFGRKWPSILAMVPYSLGWVLVAYPSSFGMMMAGRLVCGVVQGFRAPIARMYMGEVAHPRYRGRFLSAIFMLVMAGSLVNYVLALVLNWRHLALLNAAIPLALLPIQLYLPESHVWLITKGRKVEAMDALRWFRGEDYLYEQEHAATVKHFEETRHAVGSWRDIVKFQYLKPVLILIVCMLLRHFCGNTAIMFFMSQIFVLARSGLETRYAVIALGVVQLVFIILSGQMMDRMGRKKSTVISGVVMGFAQAGMGTYFYFMESPTLQPIAARHNWLPLALLSLCMVGYALGIASIIIVLSGEIVPMQIKNHTNGVINFFNTGFAFVALETFHYSLDAVRASGTFFLFSLCCFALVVFFMVALPETKGQSLEEIERRMTNRRPVTSMSRRRLSIATRPSTTMRPRTSRIETIHEGEVISTPFKLPPIVRMPVEDRPVA